MSEGWPRRQLLRDGTLMAASLSGLPHPPQHKRHW